MKNNMTSLIRRSTIWLVFWTLVFSVLTTLPGVMAEDEEGEGLPPVADAGGPYFSTECETIYFDASGSYDPEGEELWYRWNFDGTWTTWTTNPNDAYTWNDDFSGNITLEVTDGNFFVTDTAEVTVENVAPTIFVSFGEYILADLNIELEVTVEFYDPTSRAISDDSHIAEFDWGDGTVDTYEVETGAFYVNGYHTYSDIGEYQLTVTISDDDGGSSTITIIVLVQGIEIGDDVTIYEGETFSRTGCFFYEEVEVFSGVVNYGDGTADENLLLNLEDGVFNLNHLYNNVGDFTLSVELYDFENNLIGSDSLTVHVLESLNSAPSINTLNVTTPINENDTTTLTATVSDPDSEDTTLSYQINWGDESINTTGSTSDGIINEIHQYLDDDEDDNYMIKLKTYDDDGEAAIQTINITVNNVAPNITSISDLPADPVPVGSNVGLSATFTDPGLEDIHIASVDWGDGTNTSASINDRILTNSHTYSEAGVYTLTITVEDDDGGIDEEIYQYVVVYDPDSGFVTGGGWINSPEGAYKPDPTLTGKSTFGFVSKYKKGQSTPSGNTEFQFHAAKLNFHSKDYDWLVIAGSKAMYKGTGTINNEGNYGFMLSAIDGDIQGNSEDKFRIKIWDKNTDEIIYDNNISGDDDDDPATILGGGQIKIHKK
jgi:PKD repeat protein